MRQINNGSRWGGDRICPNAPDEGRASRGRADPQGRPQPSKALPCERLVRVRNSKSDSGSKPKACGIQARAASPKRGANLGFAVRADSRLFFSQVSTPNKLLPELEPHQHRVSPMPKKNRVRADRQLSDNGRLRSRNPASHVFLRVLLKGCRRRRLPSSRRGPSF